VTPTARAAASIDLLAAIDDQPTRPADSVANDYFRARRYIGAGDRRDVSDRVWRILRADRRLSWWLARQDAPPTARLKLAASLLLEGWSVQRLEQQAFGGGRFGAGPLGAEELSPLGALAGHSLDDRAMPDAVRLEVPDWILPRLRARFGESLEAELSALSAEAPLDLRVNLLRGSRDAAQSALAAEGIEAKPTPHSPWGLRVAARRHITAGAAFRSGLVEIQDEGSQMVAAMVEAAPDMRVADLCAGAGGKTLAMAMTMENRGHIVACDVSAVRLDGAVRRLRRAGVHNVERHHLVAGDKWAKRRAASFDRVLVDAPCTGIGTWRRNPDARRTLKPQDLDELIPKQAGILDQAAGLVRKGGRLIYATCSLLAEENEAQVSAFLSRHENFAAAGQVLSLTPLADGTDGFYAVRLERTA
jgi:16S rRNA (cytosine967-C5)-methyltransferase